MDTELIEQPLNELRYDGDDEIDQVMEELSNTIADDILDEEVRGIFDDFVEPELGEDAAPAEICNICSTQHEYFCPSCNLNGETPTNLDICNAGTEDDTMEEWMKVDQTWQHP
jgi:hypothetical protein